MRKKVAFTVYEPFLRYGWPKGSWMVIFFAHTCANNTLDIVWNNFFHLQIRNLDWVFFLSLV